LVGKFVLQSSLAVVQSLRRAEPIVNARHGGKWRAEYRSCVMAPPPGQSGSHAPGDRL